MNCLQKSFAVFTDNLNQLARNQNKQWSGHLYKQAKFICNRNKSQSTDEETQLTNKRFYTDCIFSNEKLSVKYKIHRFATNQSHILRLDVLLCVLFVCCVQRFATLECQV